MPSTLASRAVAGNATSRRWSTPRWLWSATGLAVALTLVFWLAATSVLSRGQADVRGAKDRAAPAFVSARTAQAALADADRAAWQSARSGTIRLTGPGRQFRDDLTAAGDGLARLAQSDLGGAAGRDRIREVNAQVVAYQGLVEQSDAAYREGVPALGLAYLTYASDLLHDPADGPLARLGKIAERDRAAVEDLGASFWTGTGAVVTTGGLAAVLLTHLGYVQVSMARRFRRVLNLPLLAASALLLGLALWTATALGDVEHHFDAAAGGTLHGSDRTLLGQIGAADSAARSLARNGPDSGYRLNLTAANGSRASLDSALAKAAETGALPVGLPLLSLTAAALIVGGGLLRLREFPA
ncbi:hypothetical protein [Actinomadura roseirufa]|uniref:hypothetical protein n=1 Tax=Actinomadura roseirufa TaxID=2094049 RepID=UPI0010412AD0|nr:hypothetical protein [Actinomadura roseirufa]